MKMYSGVDEFPKGALLSRYHQITVAGFLTMKTSWFSKFLKYLWSTVC